ncbi:TonB-dependent receptor [Tsuneonella mangrovi]|uniref:TonB-dependent receptor n=1 Tax=Tsuneonella mangrovi TaxID=1982042 RepID=UPI000BA1F60D|nr:TonB-dependent receptor [Tsuneonella mangrovi]
MRALRSNALGKLMLGASVLAIGSVAQPALAQSTQGNNQSSDSSKAASDSTATPVDDVIVVSGIRASLRESMNIKRDAVGVVDAISAEDIGKFPDTNLAESLQRITGVSIDRSSGEGSKVTVRGFGPEFNLVLLNGRQMPASSLGDCCSAPASRSFDFANLASEGVAAVEVYKSGRASLPTGGIGSVINIITPRPLDNEGMHGSLSAKLTVDHTFSGTKPTPEFSGIFSDTFADGKVGILVDGNYSKRKASLAGFSAGWREGYLGSENNWGSLPVDANDWRVLYVNPNLLNQIDNRPGPNDIYQVTQNAGYDFTNISRERINGQAVLQLRPVDSLTATFDYTFSQYTLDARTNSIGVWFNHVNTSSSWTDGPVAGPNFYAEHFGAGENKDLAITGAVAANRNINRSLGGNLKWQGDSGLRFELDAHHSTAESKPTTPYGSNIAVGSAIYGIEDQKVDFTHAMPVISVSMYPGSEINVGNIRPAGNAFRNGYMRDRIDEVTFRGGYDFDSDFIESLDFGATYTDNSVRSAYGVIQNDTWGGTLSAANTPDNLFTMTNLPKDLSGMEGSNDPSIIPNYFQVDTVGLINLLENQLGICSSPITGTAEAAGSCLAKYTTDRHIDEKTTAFYAQSTHKFDVGTVGVNLRLGLRYEKTDIDATTIQPLPIATLWTGDNEISIRYSPTETRSEFLSGKYDYWLPAIDLDIKPTSDVVLRASYSHTITRPDYGSMQSGLELASPIRVDGSTAGVGNPNLLPYLSKNLDLSAEWYYGPSSYLSIGFFNKNVSNFITSINYNQSAYGLTNPAQGPRVAAARAVLGQNASYTDIRAWISQNYPNALDPTTGAIMGQPDDPLVNFLTSEKINSDQTARLWGWEFAVQHSFWDTGFGALLNYTIVKSDTSYDNALRYTIPQFAVTGVSNSANAVLFYDKNGLQARIAYNWRDGFLSGYGSDPFYIQPYGQWDASASYDFGNGVSVFVDGINITNADRRGHMRSDQNVYFAQPGYARYSAGVRFKF